MATTGEPRGPGPIPALHLDDLLTELQGRLAEIVATRDRSHALLEAIVAVGSELDLPTVLRRIVETAVTLVDARYGALGVIGLPGRLSQFITVGMDDEERARIGPSPSGQGVLGLLIKEPHPLRLTDLAVHPDSYGFPAHHPAMRSFLGMPLVIRGEAPTGRPVASNGFGGQETISLGEAKPTPLPDWAESATRPSSRGSSTPGGSASSLVRSISCADNVDIDFSKSAAVSPAERGRVMMMAPWTGRRLREPR